jgi:hypothetical protein
MKHNTPANALAALLFLSASTQGQTVPPNVISLGQNNTISANFSSSWSGAGGIVLGNNNALNAKNSGLFGTGNITYTDGSIVAGSSNLLGSQAQGVAAIGTQNNSTGGASNSLMVGVQNYLEGDYEFGASYANLLGGGWNSSVGSSCMIFGTNNQIPSYNKYEFEYEPFGFPVRSILLGTGLISRSDNLTIIGQNNARTERMTGDAKPIFIVANGASASASARSNALEVLANGDIIIPKPQGDISMGIYE